MSTIFSKVKNMGPVEESKKTEIQKRFDELKKAAEAVVGAISEFEGTTEFKEYGAYDFKPIRTLFDNLVD